MSTPIHPSALKGYRTRKHWTQKQLAEATRGKNKVSEPTIKRIESEKDGLYAANDRVAEALAKALGVNVEKLSQPPSDEKEHEASLLKFGYRPLRTMLNGEEALAFQVVQHIYGIPVHSQIEMAPLFAALLAEASLAWRRERVGEIEEAANRLMTLGDGHFAFANAAYRSLEGAKAERESIAKRDLFGAHVGDDAFDLGYDPSRNNPFADFLDHLAKKVGATSVSFERDHGWKTSEGMPDYRIGKDYIEYLTGGDHYAKHAFLRGHVRLKDIPTDLLGDEKKAERIEWMVARIPKDELVKQKIEKAEEDALISQIGGDNA